ncbi:leucine--tRNA ligase, partial [Candidatus Woesearchaeota archaeon]|nr:leucine--tRNA ligase [Candidatus Woesearchaeota archaeon]
VAATLRPETVYGQTNLWVNPHTKYVKVEVEGENWIMSREAAEKLSYQKDEVILKEDIDPQKLLGKFAQAPGINREVIILPATFCSPRVGTGIVTSVPSDAPYDYIALKQLQEHPEECRGYGIDPEQVINLRIIHIIRTEGYGEFPAKEIAQRLGINSLDDPKLEEATKEVYKTGFHTGIMRETCQEYAGKKVEEAKELIKARLMEEGKADILHDLTEEVTCRCGRRVIIKRIDDQWFIKYSNLELKERSKEQAKEMNIYPQEYYDNMPGVIDWFGDRACARLGNWLGSKLPFDHKWIIEPISDSTLYPAYYIVSKFINNKTIKTDELTEDFFDYIFLGKGNGKEHWKPIREEFDYFYPLNMNLGGKEHKTVHFPVFLMNHVAILPEDKWPRGIFVNWWVIGSGSKISKSKGGAEPITKAIEKYGVDAMRLYYAHLGSPHVDVVWTEETVLNYKNSLERVYALCEQLRGLKGKHKKSVDDWLLSRINEHLKNINRSLKEYDLRELTSITYFTIYDDLRWYVRRDGGNERVIKEVLETWCKLMSPVTPHLSEELNWQGKYIEGLVSTSSWPTPEESKLDFKAEAGEELVKQTMEGMRNVLKLAKIDAPKTFNLSVAENWLYHLFEIVSSEIKVTHHLGEIMRKVIAIEELQVKNKEISKIVPGLLKDTSKIPKRVTSQENEVKVLNEAREFLEKEFNCAVKIIAAEESTHPKAKSAIPGKVGILIE